MAGNGRGFQDDPLAPGCCSQLLFGDEVSDGCFGFASPFSSDDRHGNIDAPKMLCFGDYAKQCNEIVVSENGKKPGQTSGPPRTASSSLSFTNATENSSLPNSNKKRNGSRIQNPGDCAGAPNRSQRSSKKPKSDNCSAPTGHAKVVKKEKLGERITALQQLVSPFGKTDTASVLHEALGYIRFLQDQVQVLCSPYLQHVSPSLEAPGGSDDGESKAAEGRKDALRSRGLCLVPVELTIHVADSNGADLWSPAAIFDTAHTI